MPETTTGIGSSRTGRRGRRIRVGLCHITPTFPLIRPTPLEIQMPGRYCGPKSWIFGLSMISRMEAKSARAKVFREIECAPRLRPPGKPLRLQDCRGQFAKRARSSWFDIVPVVSLPRICLARKEHRANQACAGSTHATNALKGKINAFQRSPLNGANATATAEKQEKASVQHDQKRIVTDTACLYIRANARPM